MVFGQNIGTKMYIIQQLLIKYKKRDIKLDSKNDKLAEKCYEYYNKLRDVSIKL